VFNHNYPGRLITVSGTDGAGKSMLTQHIAAFLTSRGREVLLTRQPTKELRKHPMFYSYIYDPAARQSISYQALLALMLSDRLEHQFSVVLPALIEGKFVVSDRYIFTLIAAMRARGYDEDWVHALVDNHIVRPDLAVLLTAPLNVIIHRISQREDFQESYLEPSLLIAMQHEYMKCVVDYNLAAFDSDAMNESQLADGVKTLLERLL
jgi:dTMP kinase